MRCDVLYEVFLIDKDCLLHSYAHNTGMSVRAPYLSIKLF